MKKLIKFLISAAAVAGIAFGAYYVYKNYIKDYLSGSDDEEEELLDDDFEIAGDEEESREYVSINVPAEEAVQEEETAADDE